jgi:transposase, IS30 family
VQLVDLMTYQLGVHRLVSWRENISERPAEAADRAVPGHWEGDLIDGKAGKSHIGPLVERATRFTMLVPLPDSKGADVFAAAMTPVIAGLPDALRRSLTWDQSAEMTRHAQMPRTLSPFCHPERRA